MNLKKKRQDSLDTHVCTPHNKNLFVLLIIYTVYAVSNTPTILKQHWSFQ